MAQLIKAVIDTQKNSYRSIGQVNAADDLELELEVKMNGQPIEFINPECELLIKKSDNNKVRQTKDIIYQDGKFKIKVDEQGVTCTGIVVNQLTINDGGRISTCLFYFMVATSLDGEILKSISKVEVLEQLEEYIVTAFANLKDFEEKVLSSDETIRKLNYDMNESEKIRDTAELQRQETFKSLKENMNEAITNLESSINLSNMNEKERSEVFNSLKSNLESIKQDLINLNASVESEEEKRVQAEINRVNKALEIIEKLESTNNSVATAEAERVSEFNKIKTENNTLKEALTTINNTANSNEEVRKENETSRVEAEKARVNEFNTMKLENETFKQEINEQYEDIVTEFDKVIANVTNGNENATNSEIVQARGKEVNLNARLDNFDEQLDTIEYNINSFPRNEFEDSDLPRIMRAINTIPNGSTLKFNCEVYLISTNTNTNTNIVIDKKINIKGFSKATYDHTNDVFMLNGTIFKNGGIEIMTNDCKFTDFSIDITGSDYHDGIFGNRETVKNCIIENVSVNAQGRVGHCFLFESYKGDVSDILVRNCEAFNGVHGFISKAKNITFENCNAYNCTTNGFGFISDNMKDGQPAICSGSKAVNCNSYKCKNGFNAYCRDYNKNNGVVYNDVKFINCSDYENITVGFILGDTGEDETEFKKLYCNNILMVNCSQLDNKASGSINLNRVKNSTIVNCYVENKVIKSGWQQNVMIENISSWWDSYKYDLRKELSINTVQYSNEIDLLKGTTYQLGSGFTGTITFKNDNPLVNTFTINLIPSNGNNMIFSGFDSSKFILPIGFIANLNYGTGKILSFVRSGFNKWVCSSCVEINY